MPLYFLTCVLIFWVPGVALMAAQWSGLPRAGRRAFWLACASMALLTFVMEYAYLWADIWSFTEAHDPLLGIEILGAPIEEFTFWFGASPFTISVYLTWRRLLGREPASTRRRRRG